MEKALETQRLIMRKITLEDKADIAEIIQDKETMYAYEHTFRDDELDPWIQRHLDRYRQYGYGWWALIDKKTGDYIGHAGLSMQPMDGEEVLEVGYHIKKKHWGKGYASEAAIASKEYAFNVLGADKVYSLIVQTNDASINVAKKNGMHLEKAYIRKDFYGKDSPHYGFMVQNEKK